MPIFFFFFLISSSQLFGTAGKLDPAFGEGGLAKIVRSRPAFFGGLKEKPNGQLIGLFTEAGKSFKHGLVQFTECGNLDKEYGKEGFSTFPSGEYLGDFVLDSKNRALVHSNRYTNSAIVTLVLRRFTEDGKADLSFGVGGAITVAGKTMHDGRSILALDKKGNLIAGSPYYLKYDPTYALRKFTPAGVLDFSFGNFGTLETGVDELQSMDSKILVDSKNNLTFISSKYLSGDHDQPIAIRILENGTKDKAFGNNGVLKIPLHVTDKSWMRDAAFDSVGNMIIAGVALTKNAYDWDSAIVRFRSDGKLDTTFAEKGYFYTHWEDKNDSATEVAIDKNGKIVFAYSPGHMEKQIGIGRLDRNGVLDKSFGKDGYLDLEALGFEDLYELLIDSKGRVVIFGSNDEHLLLARVLSE